MAEVAPAEQEKVTDQTPPGLEGNIALAFSGGGYRAAGFSLGVLSYLHRLDMLKQVTMLSTVSGGTFTGVKYVLSLIDKVSFPDFFNGYCDELNNNNLIALALGQIGRNSAEGTAEQGDLVTSIADVYATTFFQGPDKKPILFEKILNAKNIGIKDVIFNSTEFHYGNAFRFQTSEHATAFIGNGNIHIDPKDAGQIRLADIVAASSCFPGGFEPFYFPIDFKWPDNIIPKGLDNLKAVPVALMDGGIFDNQGIGSILNAFSRKGASGASLFLIADVNTPATKVGFYPYLAPTKLSGVYNLSLGTLDCIIHTLSFLTIAIAGILIYAGLKTGGWWFWIDIIAALFLAPPILAVYWFRNLAQSLFAEIPKVGIASWSDIKRLSLGLTIRMIKLRITSLYTMSSDIFMKHVRALMYNEVLTNDKYTKKTVPTLIYDLLNVKPKSPLIAPPSKTMTDFVELAANFPTTLWFNDPTNLTDQVGCGQATLCFKLMNQIVIIHGEDPTTYPPRTKKIWDQLLIDWKTLNANPITLAKDTTQAISAP